MQQSYKLTFHDEKGAIVGNPIVETTGYMNLQPAIEAVCKAFESITSWTIEGSPVRPEKKS